MTISSEQHAQAIFDKAGRIEVGYRHENTTEETFLAQLIRKLLGLALRPITSIIKEIAGFQKTFLEQNIEAIESLKASRAASESQVKHLQNLISETNRQISDLNVELEILRSTAGTSRRDSGIGVVWDEFYKRFEDRFRGDPTIVQERMASRYRLRLAELFNRTSVRGHTPILIDLGCGRGEFLNLARDIGYKTIGVDSGAAMVREASNHGHEAHLGDLYIRLKTYADSSVEVLTMFHVIEHCQAEYILNLFREAARVLKPGGVFVVETPSIFSLWVTGRQFHLDPTHTQPVHPDYVSFLAVDSGFSNAELLEFENVEHSDRATLAAVSSGGLTAEFRKLEKWLYGPQDVCIWATK
jgi:SAM-dependent methyltransferase